MPETIPDIRADKGFLGNDLFPEVTFENSPQEVEIKIKTK